jgi:hypothetical protein
MISLTCANCQASLEVDDAFAGGVCRCQHCGTIQTVPRAGAAQKTLYKQKQRPESIGAGTGLDELANIVTSSGLNSGRLRRPREDTAKKKLTLILAAAGAVIMLLLIVVAFLLMRTDEPSQSLPSPSVIPAPTPKAAEPNFLSTPVSEQTVIYLLDRGDASKDSFGYLKDATLNSVESLGPTRRFQIIFWNNGSDVSFPLGNPISASPENVSAARKALEDIDAFGKTSVKTALQKATLNNPQLLFLVTAKAWDLDDAFVEEVLNLRGGNRYVIRTVAVGDPGTSNALKTIADKTGGQFHAVDKTRLRELAGD